jgi:carboxypeptidase Taq
MEAKLQGLKARLAEIVDIDFATAVLGWDQNTFMPVGGAAARGRQSATLAKLSQEKMIDPALGRLLDELLPYAESLDPDSDDARLIQVVKRDYDKLVKVPPEFIGRMYEHIASTYQAWAEARPKNNFKAVQSKLEKTLALSRELANFFPGYDHIGDPLIDNSDYGMKTVDIRRIFSELRKELVPLVQAVTSQPPADDSCLKQYYSPADQLAFGEDVARQIGYDFDRGRLDQSPHPFTTRFSINDVRITTRIQEKDFNDSFFSIVHEAGHAMYEQGVAQELEGTHLASGTSAGVHESQSRLWENLVGRSRGFWSFYYPKAQERFPAQLGNVSLETFYRAINKVQPSLIRTDADELTYNLHVMIRFDLEMDLLEGKLTVKDLPEAWRERYRSDLGIAPQDDRDGCMQDVHWYGGIIGGAFQGYTLGNILSALFYAQAVQTHPSIPTEISQGQFGTLSGWMRDHIYRYGRKYTANEIVEKATGGPMRIEPYIAYLRGKYGELYQL